MKRLESEQFEHLLNLPRKLPIAQFEKMVDGLMKKKMDKDAAIQELDIKLAVLQNHIQLLAMYIKQNYLIRKSSSQNGGEQYYTKQELANKYRVSVRTITNWIIDGLEVEEVGGIKRISFDALKAFKESVKGKKFQWKSIARDHRSL
jgi:hypothetical protein